MYNVNPYIFSVPINEEYVLVINPLKNNAVRLLNIPQYKLLYSIDKPDITKYISENQENEQLRKFLEIIQQEDFANTSNVFHYRKISQSKSLSLWVHTTDACNLRCKYCYIHTKETNLQMQEDVILALCNKIIQTADENKLQKVILRMSGGEPFLNYKLWNKHFDYLKEKLSEYDCILSAIFLTNFTLINDNIINFIQRYNIHISGSIDGIGKFNDHTRIMKNGNGTFKIIEKNIKKLRESGITPFLMTVVSNNNLDGLVEFTKYVIKENLSMRFSIVQHDNFDYEKALPIFKECYKIFEQAIENGYEFSKKHKLGDLHFIEFSDHTCSCGRNAGTIYVNGDIFFCQQQIGNTEKLGNIFDEQNLINVIISGNFYNDELNEECFKCKYRYICSGGCPLSRVNGKSESCKFYHKIIPVIYNLIGLERLKQINDLKQKNEK